MNRTMLSILKILEKHQERPLGSRELSRQLRLHGVELTERTVRYHLKIMDEKGLTKVYGKEGRKITPRGVEELRTAMVSDRVGFIISKIETLSYQTDFDPESERGGVILNVSCFPEEEAKSAIRVMKPVFASPYVMSDRVALARGGEHIADVVVPEGMIGIGTVCSVTVNGIFLRSSVPVTSKFGGILQIEDGEPTRFVSVISYSGSSLDPHLVFIKSGMTTISEAVKRGHGTVLASFREIPVVCVEKAVELQERLRSIGIGGILLVGNPNQPLVEMPVGMDRAGMVVVGGLNPVGALEEAGIASENAAMAILKDYSELVPFKDAVKDFS
ncbi:MAG: NrpR regulatory domain-containing protein [Nitrospirota bacterium]|jgi:repressor of nif and glnA expression